MYPRRSMPGFRIESRRSLRPAELNAVARLLEGGGMGRRTPGKLRRAIAGSTAVVVARTGSAVVGFGRLIGDGTYYAAIWDVVVDPAWRGRGVGREMIAKLMWVAQRQKLRMVGLLTESKNFRFYRHAGFNVVPSVRAMMLQTEDKKFKQRKRRL